MNQSLVEGTSRTLITVDEQTALSDVVKLVPDHVDALLLVTDINQQVVGAVSSEEIQNQLRCDHETERRRWLQMPVGALMPVRIPSAFTNIAWIDQPDAEGTDAAGGVSSFVCGGDIFISWRKLAPELRQAFRDTLTGLPNRAGLEFHLDQDWQRARCGGLPLAMMVIDVDRFKTINDTHGHIFADGILKEFALTLKNSVRSYDVVTRFGGDEFVAICVGCGPDEIDIPIRRMLEGIGDIASQFGGDIAVSASIGAALCMPSTSDTTPKQLLQTADDCLYFAKNENRNTAFVTDLTAKTEPGRSPRQVGLPYRCGEGIESLSPAAG